MIGGGKYLDPTTVETKEDADHSLPYLVAVALLDGEVQPEQFEVARIRRPDVQQLMRKVHSSKTGSLRKIIHYRCIFESLLAPTTTNR